MSIRISKKLLSTLPKIVADEIKRLADDYGIKSLTYKHEAAPYRLYLGEGDRITLIRGEQVGSLEMVAEHNIGAAGVSHQIGDSFNVPVGTTIIRISYYAKFWMDVVNVGPYRLPEKPQIDSEAIQRSWKALADIATASQYFNFRQVGEVANFLAVLTKLYVGTPDAYNTEWLIIRDLGTGEWKITNRNLRTSLAPATTLDEATQRLYTWTLSHQTA